MIYTGDCLDVLKTLPADSVDAIVTDPPYGLSFMGKRWDYDVPSEAIWRECLRVLKPGGHLLAFAGTRTQHRMAVRIEDAGFEIRDMIAWVYGSGFPKSLDVSKAIDKAAGAEREVIGPATVGGKGQGNAYGTITRPPATAPATAWQGWGTALKPALEPITVARKPLIGTVAENVLAHGTGALNVDGCRVGTESTIRNNNVSLGGSGNHIYGNAGACVAGSHSGRWPANLIHDGSEEVVGAFGAHALRKDACGAQNANETTQARFFYCAKASKADRDEGCEGMEEKEAGIKNDSGRGFSESDPMAKIMRRNHHPTVKPTALMQYLCRLVTPPNGIVLDPFMGSGSTGKAAMLEGFDFIGIERDPEYVKIAEARIGAARRLL